MNLWQVSTQNTEGKSKFQNGAKTVLLSCNTFAIHFQNPANISRDRGVLKYSYPTYSKQN